MTLKVSSATGTI